MATRDLDIIGSVKQGVTRLTRVTRIEVPARFAAFLEMRLEEALRQIREGRVPEFAEDQYPPECKATVTLTKDERPF